MMRVGGLTGRLLQHLRGNGIAYVALAVALGGTAYAAATIGTNDLKNNAVTSPKIRNGEVRPADVAGTGKIITRCAIDAPVTVTGTSGFPDLPGFKGCTWNQPAGTLDTFYARAKIGHDAACAASSESLHLRVTITGGGSGLLVSDFLVTPAMNPAEGTFLLPTNAAFAWLTPDFHAPTFQPPWTLIPQGRDTCGDGNFRLEKFEIVVVRVAG